MIYEYGVMSSKFSLEADNNLTAYATMVLHFAHYEEDASLIAIYAPEEAKKDSWLLADNVEERLDAIFGGKGKLLEYIKEHAGEIYDTFDTIQKLV